MSPRSAVLPLAAVLLAAQGASACGICVDDKVAAAYDYAVIQRASARHQHVVFLEVLPRKDGTRPVARAARLARAAKGVDPASVRVSTEPPVVSFAIDPARVEPARVVASMERSVALQLLKTIE